MAGDRLRVVPYAPGLLPGLCLPFGVFGLALALVRGHDRLVVVVFKRRQVANVYRTPLLEIVLAARVPVTERASRHAVGVEDVEAVLFPGLPLGVDAVDLAVADEPIWWHQASTRDLGPQVLLGLVHVVGLHQLSTMGTTRPGCCPGRVALGCPSRLNSLVNFPTFQGLISGSAAKIPIFR